MKPIEKDIGGEEMDPKVIQEHREDAPNSFLSMYRSIDNNYSPVDEALVGKLKDRSVVAKSIRYATMGRGDNVSYRGIAKSVDNNVYYFNWFPQKDSCLISEVPPEIQYKSVEADKLYRASKLGCDFNKSEDILDSEETVEEATDDEKKTSSKKGGVVESSSIAPIKEGQYIKEQNSEMTEVHPGSINPQTPEDGNTGRDWHKSVDQDTRSPYYGTLAMLKFLGNTLKETAPCLNKSVPPLERKYMQEVLGRSDEEINKGVKLGARHKAHFELWKSATLNSKLNHMQSWLDRSGT